MSIRFHFLEELGEDTYCFLLICLVEFTSETSGFSAFFLGMLFIIDAFYYNRFRFRLSISSCVSFGCFLSFKELAYFIYVIKFVGIELLVMFLYYPFMSLGSIVMTPLS